MRGFTRCRHASCVLDHEVASASVKHETKTQHVNQSKYKIWQTHTALTSNNPAFIAFYVGRTHF